MVDIDQFLIFQKWNHTNFGKSPTTTKDNILYTLTGEERNSSYNDYIADKIQNLFPIQTSRGSLLLPFESLSIINVKKKECTSYRGKSVGTIAANNHHNVTNKISKLVPNFIEATTKYPNFNTENNLVSSRQKDLILSYHGLKVVKNSDNEILKSYNISKYRRAYFIGIGAYWDTAFLWSGII